MSGPAYMNQNQENEVSLVESQVKNRLQEMTEEMLPTISELIHVAKSSSDPTNSVIFQRLLLGHKIHSQPQTKSSGCDYPWDSSGYPYRLPISEKHLED